MEPITELVRLIDVDDEYAEYLPGPALPVWAEPYLAEQRAFWRLLRHGGVLTLEEQRPAARSTSSPRRVTPP